jgi:hypothetical protein
MATNAGRLRAEHRSCCGTRRMREGQCSITQPPGEQFIMSGTKYQAAHGYDDKLCDYFVFWLAPPMGESIAVVELKGGHVPASAATQLANGAAVAESLVTAGGGSAFAALLAIRRGIHSIDRKYIARQRIKFFGVEYPIQTVSCGSRLIDAPPWSTMQTSTTTSTQGRAQGSRARRR